MRMTDTILDKRKILCADGHEDTCLMVRYLLKPFGYEVTTVNDLNSGLRIARTADYDLYLITYKLTEGTGIEFCEKLREFDRQTRFSFVPHAFMTLIGNALSRRGPTPS